MAVIYLHLTPLKNEERIALNLLVYVGTMVSAHANKQTPGNCRAFILGSQSFFLQAIYLPAYH